MSIRGIEINIENGKDSVVYGHKILLLTKVYANIIVVTFWLGSYYKGG